MDCRYTKIYIRPFPPYQCDWLCLSFLQLLTFLWGASQLEEWFWLTRNTMSSSGKYRGWAQQRKSCTMTYLLCNMLRVSWCSYFNVKVVLKHRKNNKHWMVKCARLHTCSTSEDATLTTVYNDLSTAVLSFFSVLLHVFLTMTKDLSLVERPAFLWPSRRQTARQFKRRQ